MKAVKSLLASAGLTAALIAGGAQAAGGGGADVLDHTWSFEGAFGTYDSAQLQRGWQVYAEVCAACHGLELVAFRSLGDPRGPAFPPEQVKAIAKAFNTKIADIDGDGEPIERDALPTDHIPSPFANEEQAKASNGGAIPPDLSLITKARIGYHGTFKQLIKGAGGPEYVYSLMLGYQDEPPKGFDVGDLNYNKYFPGHKIAMANQLSDELVDYQGEVPETKEQYAADVTAFLHWAAEPNLPYRKEAGIRNLLFLAFFAVLLWYANKQLWKPIKEGGSGF